MTDRRKLLENAIGHTCGDRDAEYGSPKRNLADCGALWGAYLRRKYGISNMISAEDVAHMNVLQKIARTFNGTIKDDTYEDMAAYSAIAGECAEPAVIEDVEFTAPAPTFMEYNDDHNVCIHCGEIVHINNTRFHTCPETAE